MKRYQGALLGLLLLAGHGDWTVHATTDMATPTVARAGDASIAVSNSETGSAAAGALNVSPSQQDIQQLQHYFFAAARAGELTVLQEFLTAGYPVNERNAQSYTALMIAAYAGQAQAVTALLQAGADACLRDKRGHTALMGAMIKAEWEIARTLYNIDCDRDNQAKATDVVKDKQQMTAAQFAEIFGQSDQFKALGERSELQP